MAGGVLLALGMGCNGGQVKMREQLARLSVDMTALNQSQEALFKRMRDMENRLTVIRDRVEVNSKTLEKGRALPPLPLVRLAPAEEDPQPLERAELQGDVIDLSDRNTRMASRSPVSARSVARGQEAQRELEEEFPWLDEERIPVGPRLHSPEEQAVAVSRPTAEDRKAYGAAFDLMKARDIDGALKAFEHLVGAHPGSEFADNALYWRGECFYDRKEFDLAMAEFRAVVQRYPGGNKVADAMLKVAFCLINLERKGEATTVLQQVMDAHPASAAARLAKERLAQIGP